MEFNAAAESLAQRQGLKNSSRSPIIVVLERRGTCMQRDRGQAVLYTPLFSTKASSHTLYCVKMISFYSHQCVYCVCVYDPIGRDVTFFLTAGEESCKCLSPVNSLPQSSPSFAFMYVCAHVLFTNADQLVSGLQKVCGRMIALGT